MHRENIPLNLNNTHYNIHRFGKRTKASRKNKSSSLEEASLWRLLVGAGSLEVGAGVRLDGQYDPV